VEKPTTSTVSLGQAEKAAEADPIDDQHGYHRQPEYDAERERDHDHADVRGHDQTGGLRPLISRYMRPQLLVVDLVDQAWRHDGVSRVGIGEDDEEGDERGNEQERSRGQDERPRLPVRARQRLEVEPADSLPDLAPPAVHDAVAPRHQTIEIAMHGLARPVTLGAGEVRRGAPV